jgi:hypothetical protein
MRARILNLDFDSPAKKKWRSPFHDWPRPAAKRNLIERLLRKVWLFRWDRHSHAFAATGISYCQSKDYRDRKVARYFPIRNWLVEELPSLHRPLKYKLRNIYWDIRHRIPGQYWHHTMHLGLKPGYYDADTKMLHAVFEIVRWYVEVQLAGHSGDKEQYTWYGDRSPEAGLAHLDWEIEECGVGGGGGGQLSQGEAASIKKDVYLWWTRDRPARREPYDIRCYIDNSRVTDRMRDKGMWGLFNNHSPKHDAAMAAATALEEFYNKEDKEMLEKAVSILHYWWD